LGSAANNRTGNVREKRMARIARVRVFIADYYFRDIGAAFKS
jgi:hypothetical protein